MKVKKLREYLKGLKDSDDFLISCDEELNVLYKDGEVAEIGFRVRGFGPFNYNWGAAVVWFANKS